MLALVGGCRAEVEVEEALAAGKINVERVCVKDIIQGSPGIVLGHVGGICW